MSMNSVMSEFQDLASTSIDPYEEKSPESEFFHSIYISGKSRRSETGEMEQAGLIQIRGIEKNLSTVHMIITHVKQVLVKNGKHPSTQKETLECFSYQDGSPPWNGITVDPDTGQFRVCGNTSADRAAVPFCSPCRSQIIVSGIYCDPKGKPILNESKEPIFVFIRARGMKYSNVSKYLNDLSTMDLEPLIQPATDETRKFEKAVVNNKRFVTTVVPDIADSKYGAVNVFGLSKGAELPGKIVLEILKIAKKSVDKFNDKFDWSKKKKLAQPVQPSHISEHELLEQFKVEANIPTEKKASTVAKPEPVKEENKESETLSPDSFGFSDIEF